VRSSRSSALPIPTTETFRHAVESCKGVLPSGHVERVRRGGRVRDESQTEVVGMGNGHCVGRVPSSPLSASSPLLLVLDLSAMHVQRINTRPLLSVSSMISINKHVVLGSRSLPRRPLSSAGRFASCTTTARLLDAQPRRNSNARPAA
jgi:hypothetical protein